MECHQTNEGRYGKFYVSEWDLAGNLTIEWLTLGLSVGEGGLWYNNLIGVLQ
jgi:hypothetical protein